MARSNCDLVLRNTVSESLMSLCRALELVAESSDVHLTLHRAIFFQLEIRKKAGHFK